MEFLAGVMLAAVMALPFILIGGALVDFFQTRDSNRHSR